jgi:hypothetical protein
LTQDSKPRNEKGRRIRPGLYQFNLRKRLSEQPHRHPVLADPSAAAGTQTTKKASAFALTLLFQPKQMA